MSADAVVVKIQHPVSEHEDWVLNRRKQMVEYRAHLIKSEEWKIQAERLEIEKTRALLQSQRAARRSTERGSSPQQTAEASLE